VPLESIVKGWQATTGTERQLLWIDCRRGNCLSFRGLWSKEQYSPEGSSCDGRSGRRNLYYAKAPPLTGELGAESRTQ
jgi:hypothetical protein